MIQEIRNRYIDIPKLQQFWTTHPDFGENCAILNVCVRRQFFIKFHRESADAQVPLVWPGFYND